MANIPIWPGSSSFDASLTPFSFYDNDTSFQTDAVNAADFVAIDWGSKARDWLLTAYPQLRDAKLRTNSLNLALNNLLSEGGIAVLPTNIENQIPANVNVTKIRTLENVPLRLYIHSMKQIRRVGLAEIIDSVSTVS